MYEIRRKFCLLLVFLAIWGLCEPTFTQDFQDLIVKQNQDTIEVQYSLLSNQLKLNFFVGMNVSSDNGRKFDIVPRNVWGDIGGGIKAGSNKKIFWLPLEDSLELIGNQFVFKLDGEILGVSKVPEFIPIKGGNFMMGNINQDGESDENKIHTTKLSSYEISKYEITNIQYIEFLRAYGTEEVKDGEWIGEKLLYDLPKGIYKLSTPNNSSNLLWSIKSGYEFYPVINVTWFGASEYCKYYGYRLPSEAEWEYAAKQLTDTIKYGNGKSIATSIEMNFLSFEGDSNAVFRADSIYTVPVCGYKPNNIGLYDMSGNVWEWCADWYKGNYYFYSNETNPTGPIFGRYKVIRGGSWFCNENGVTTTNRSFIAPYENRMDVGFRVVRDPNLKE